MGEHVLVAQARLFRIEQVVFKDRLSAEGQLVDQVAVVGVRLSALLIRAVKKLVRFPRQHVKAGFDVAIREAGVGLNKVQRQIPVAV